MAAHLKDDIYICGKCKKPKHISEYTKEKSRWNGHASSCRDCSNKKNRDIYHKYKDRRKAYRIAYRLRRRELHLEQKFGLTLNQYNSLLTEQNGACAICNTEPKKWALGVDHCHKSNKIRGLLCDSCNLGLGYFKDNPELLLKAAEYIRKSFKK